MAIFSVDYRVRQKHRSWHYNFWKDSASARQVVDDVRVWQDVPRKIGDFHHGTTTIDRVTASNPLAPGYSASHKVYIDGSAGDRPDVVSTSIQLIMRGAQSIERTLDIRGVPDGLVEFTISGNTVIKALVLQEVPALNAILGGAGFGVRYKQRAVGPTGVPDPDVGWRDVEALAAAENTNGSRTLFTTQTPHGFEVNDLVQVSRISDCTFRNLAGEWRVVRVVNDDSFEIERTYKSKEAVASPPNIRVRKIVYLLDPITHCEFNQNTTRNTGTFSGGPKGRASAISCN